MTPEAQRIAIAEAMGWTNIRTFEGYLFGVRPGEKVMMRTAACLTPSESIPVPSHVPKYLGSLDAIAQATDKLIIGNLEQATFHFWLYSMTGSKYLAATAKAPIRAEALLRTIGKWEGETPQTCTCGHTGQLNPILEGGIRMEQCPRCGVRSER